MARILVNVDRRAGSIDPFIYGQFIEHLDRCIYGGIFEPGSPLSGERGFRTDVLAAIRDLRPGIVRWPGGNFASGYHWLDGVGSERQARPELAWHSVEPNTFGTDEYIAYCRAAGCEPYICLNMGNGTMDEAIAWVEYCNLPGGTRYSDLRRAHGYEQPHNVAYWALGNELWGDFQIGHKSSRDYAEMARDWAKVLKRLDPGLRLVACGGTGGSPSVQWDLDVLERCADLIDYIAIHHYWGPQADDPYSSALAGVYDFERYVTSVEGSVDAVRRDKRLTRPIWLSIDEWNIVYPSSVGEHHMRYTLRDALADAVFVHMLQRHCKTVRMANLAQTVNVVPVIKAGPEGVFLQAIYWPLWLGANVGGDTLVDCWADAGSYHAAVTGDLALPLLDVTATLDETGGRLVLSVVNAHESDDIEAEVAIVGAAVGQQARVHTLNAEATDAYNDWGHPESVRPVCGSVAAASSTAYKFPAHSLTLIEFALG